MAHQLWSSYQCHPRGGDVLDVGQGVNRPGSERDPSRTHSVLYSPMVVLAKPLSRASPTVPIDEVSPSSIGVLLKCIAVYCVRRRRGGWCRRITGDLPGRGTRRRGAERASTKPVFLVSEHSQPRDQPGVGVDDERGVAEPGAVQRHVGEVGQMQRVGPRESASSIDQVRARAAAGSDSVVRGAAAPHDAAPAVGRMIRSTVHRATGMS